MYSSSRRFGPVMAAYIAKVDSGVVRRDPSQIALATRLDNLHSALASLPPPPSSFIEKQQEMIHSTSSDLLKRSIASLKNRFRRIPFFAPTPSPQGLYIYGSVGVGKSFLMDLFFDSLTAQEYPNSTTENDSGVERPATVARQSRRVHFHEFMSHVHSRIFAFKKVHPKRDVVPLVAFELFYEDAQILCFDEFQVTDIGDAMILKRLFDILFDLGVVVVATSNRSPEDLYVGGINRSLFLPFIENLRRNCSVVSMDSMHDYRRDTKLESGAESYFFLDASSEQHQDRLENIFGPQVTSYPVSVSAHFGRTIQVTRANLETGCAWFDFPELCHEPLGAADYLSLCQKFPTIIIDQVPQLDANFYNEARRFVTLIDAAYEIRTRLVIRARVPLDELFVAFDVALESTDGDEELQEASASTALPPLQESFVSGEGGSSSSFSTTMILNNGYKDAVEWSATGRIGVSLAQLSAANDISFSFRRAASRLVEMGGLQWGRKAVATGESSPTSIPD